ncbi:MAG TPA: hypothetical protein VNE41_11355 [Chitinophagaceae bacterium]|nr:hypothetical protein [Chitinophagaceae bacterium]
MTEPTFTPEDSLRLIQDMVNRTKNDLADDSFYFLVWGWLVLIASLSQYVLLVFLHNPYHYLAWQLIWVGVIISVIHSRGVRKTSRVRTYVGESMKYLWMGTFIAFFVLSMIFTVSGWDRITMLIYPGYMILYGLGTFVSGNLIRFRPLIIGGIIAWLLAIGAAGMKFEDQILAGSAAILVSYIIPGYLLRYRRHKMRKQFGKP